MNYSFFKSRTVWTIIAMFIIGGGNALLPVIPTEYSALVMLLLSGLATYFHVNPSQEYNKPE